MKMRMGFVSNSSSGSFILHWRFRGFGEKINIERAVGNAFNVYFKDDTDEIDWENSWNPEMKDRVEEVIKHTVMAADGSFISTFVTSMVNSPEDFGEAAKSLVMGIVADEGGMLEIIDAKTEVDG